MKCSRWIRKTETVIIKNIFHRQFCLLFYDQLMMHFTLGRSFKCTVIRGVSFHDTVTSKRLSNEALKWFKQKKKVASEKRKQKWASVLMAEHIFILVTYLKFQVEQTQCRYYIQYFEANTTKFSNETLVELATFFKSNQLNAIGPWEYNESMALMGWIKSKNKFSRFWVCFHFSFFSFNHFRGVVCFRHSNELKAIIRQRTQSRPTTFSLSVVAVQFLKINPFAAPLATSGNENGVKSAIRSASKSTATRHITENRPW